MSAPDLMD